MQFTKLKVMGSELHSEEVTVWKTDGRKKWRGAVSWETAAVIQGQEDGDPGCSPHFAPNKT